MQILNHRQIEQKIQRLAIEILEHNIENEEIILAGINNNGMEFAQMLTERLLKLSEKEIILTRIRLNPAKPNESEVHLEMPLERLNGKAIILVDDVANTGRTIFYAIKPLLDILPAKIEVAVLVDRKHKAFPIRVDYVGMTLATTLKENIEVQIRDVDEFSVNLN